jgi:hypothetical protein
MAPSHQDRSAVSQYNSKVLVGAGSMLTVIPVFVVGLRFYARRKIRTHYGIDDWMILLALVRPQAPHHFGTLVETHSHLADTQPRWWNRLDTL